MNTITEILSQYSGFFWKPIRVAIEDERALMFDPSTLDPEELELFLMDTFYDGTPDNLDIFEKVPFLLIGCIDEVDEGNIYSIPKPEMMLFADIENSENGRTPVYSIEIDGTAILRTFKKVAEDISELKITLDKENH